MKTSKRRSTGLLFAAFGLGVLVSVPPFLGVLALLMGGMIALCSALESPPAAHPRTGPSFQVAGTLDPAGSAAARSEIRAFELRERLLRNTFDVVRPREATALAGFLHEHTIHVRRSPFGGKITLPALELSVAMQWVGETFGWEPARLEQIYSLDWIDLRDQFAKPILAHLEAHPQVIAVERYDELT